MFEKYNEKARRTIFFARYEASRFGSPEIGSEHLLLGLLREGKASLNVILGLSDLDAIHSQIEAASTWRESTPTSVDLPLSEESKRILAYGAEEAMRLSQKHIGIEHLLLGILREEKCIAAKILIEGGLKLDRARKLIAGALEQLAALRPAPSVQATAEEVPATRKPVSFRVVIFCDSKILLAYRSHFGPPRIGESILIRSTEGASQTYRVQNIVWELSLDEAIVLQEVKVHVALETGQ